MLKKPEHPNAMNTGYILEHRLVASEMLGRPLRQKEQVHHRNDKRDDNRPENLQVLTHKQHRLIHARRGPAHPNWTPERHLQKTCPSCSRIFVKPGVLDQKYCSKTCQGIAQMGPKHHNWTPQIEKTCPICDQLFLVKYKQRWRLFCSTKCANSRKRPR